MPAGHLVCVTSSSRLAEDAAPLLRLLEPVVEVRRVSGLASVDPGEVEGEGADLAPQALVAGDAEQAVEVVPPGLPGEVGREQVVVPHVRQGSRHQAETLHGCMITVLEDQVQQLDG
ncbi:hypothetical protein VTK73DRAFT_1203 [Phialemonium thermophilum]|uniref:Uncharacterized protein n=1 Tax=Phialemonium thermophilum TaxID=223376 RepID=A0ABR3VTR3_9PEZI